MANRNNLILLLLFLLLASQGVFPMPAIPGLPTTQKADRATYVYEKDDGIVPRPVSFALKELNKQGIIATSFEIDSTTGRNTIPTQDAIAVKSARDTGLPCLIVQSGDTVLKIVRAPTTEEQVMEAVR